MTSHLPAALKPYLTLQAAVLTACVLLIAGTGVFILTHPAAHTDSVDTLARSIVAECKKQQGDHSACYEAEVPLLYPTYPVAQIFNVVREIRTLDPSYQFCHVLGHKIGERVVAQDPNNWIDAIPSNPGDGLCSNGFIHGVIGGRFRAEVLDDQKITSLLPDFTAACMPRSSWNPSNLDRAICYHGMGHLFDYITNADIPKALALCEKVTTPDYRRVCVQGVFMQIYQPLEPDDFTLIAQMKDKPATTTVPTYCAQYASDPMAQGSCIEESWPFVRQHIVDGTGVGKLCGYEPNATEKNQCYISMSSIVGRFSLDTPGSATKACNAFPAEAQETCFSYSAEAVLEESRDESGKAVAVCESASAAIASQCVEELVHRAPFVFGGNTSEFQAFCEAVPSALKDECKKGAS